MLHDIKLEAKKRGLSQDKLTTEQLAMLARIARESQKGSTGALGKLYEPIVRHLMTAHGLSMGDFRARTQEKADIIVYVEGHAVTVEVKTGDGIVANYNDGQLEEADILPGKGAIVYCTEPGELEDLDDLLDNSIVVTRAEFIGGVLCAGQKRHPNFRSGLKAATNSAALRAENKERQAIGLEPIRDCYTMQPTYRKARWALCQSGEYTSLRTFLEEIGRL